MTTLIRYENVFVGTVPDKILKTLRSLILSPVATYVWVCLPKQSSSLTSQNYDSLAGYSYVGHGSQLYYVVIKC